jgi:ABC-type sugar transport system ATPase subunit
MEVYENPATLFVAGFIGSPAMNFLPAKADGDGRFTLLAGGQVAHRRSPTRRQGAPVRSAYALSICSPCGPGRSQS